MEPIIHLREERDFGDVINTTFHFLRQNLVPLGKSLLYIVCPVALLLGLSSAGMFSSLDLSADPDAIDGAGMVFFSLFYMVSMTAGLATMTLAVTVVQGYMILYQDRATTDISVDDVWQIVRREFWGMLGTMLLIVFIFGALYVVLLIPLVLVVALAAGGASPWISAALGILGFPLVLGVFLYLVVTYSLVFPIRMRESSGAVQALRRSHVLIKKNWWSTLLVVFIGYLLMTMLGLLFNFPGYVFAFMGTLFTLEGEAHPWWWWPLLAASVIGTLGSSLLYAIPFTATMVQYFNLVEKKERKGLVDRIEERFPAPDDGEMPYDEGLFEG